MRKKISKRWWLITFLIPVIIFLVLLNPFGEKIIIYNNPENFIKAYYEVSSGKKKDGVGIDLRLLDSEDETFDSFSKSHILGFKSYSFSNGSKEEFTTWIKGLYNIKTTIYLVDNGNNEYETVVDWLTDAGYKKILIYKLGYLSLKSSPSFTELLDEGFGTDDCGCK